ncbi:transposase [Pseudomonas nitroreducens]|uniref:Transposase n=1 Tax=Pseudomonas nitroreducens TaxID=46680 RepID=A0A246FB57_PSENT|nr:transposase [Pseudomonas nitroreducens]OWP51555.1 transposase [Pseudomonas nitroreducens]
MPRVGRVILPNYPHHVVQRGHNRQVVFVESEDYERYLADLRELKDAFGVKVYACCLMTNHVHLLLAPDESVTGLSQLMKTLSARMTRYRNRLEYRSGTLWESRFKSSLVQSDAYLLACSRYIELNPVRAKLVRRAAEYPWSSYTQHVGDSCMWIDSDPCYEVLAESEDERHDRYRAFLGQLGSDEENQLIREALQRGQLTGNSRFVDEVERISGVRIERRGQGRPSKLE